MADDSKKPKLDKLANEVLALNAGLCSTCIHVRLIESAKGSTFILCTLSNTDSRFSKYPRLPVLSCGGYSVRA
jgi:hypothetical protein